jgi:hypothetical protein
MAIGLVALLASPSEAQGRTVPVINGPVQHGINVTFFYRPEAPQVLTSQIQTTIKYVKSLGANSIAIAFHLFVSGPTSNSVSAGADTPSPTDLGTLVSAARRAHLFVLVRPLIEESNPYLPWRGEIEPTDRSAWFNSYDQALQPFLTSIQLAGANEIAISCELRTLAGDSHWTSTVIPFVSTYFHGYQLNDISWASNGMSLIPGTTLGLDTYRPLKLPNNATRAALLRGWNGWLKKLPPPAPLGRIYMLEVGIAAQSRAYSFPQKADWGTPILPQIQANWFTAACNFSKSHGFRSIYFWSTSLIAGPQTHKIGGLPTDFQGAANTAIRACFR